MASQLESAIQFMRGAITRARPLQKTIVFPEGGDPRVLEAAARLARDGILKPVLVGQFEYVEWTSDAHLRHSRFMALRDDKKPKDVRRE